MFPLRSKVHSTRLCYILVDWVRASEAERELTTEQKERQADVTVRKGGSQRFGGEDWKNTAAEEFIEKQEDDYLPVVFFASGATSTFELKLARAHLLTLLHLRGHPSAYMGHRRGQ
jgi:1-aminocyclopropane-1-carboxylate deaminase/D-cysteine desulfhydrase-like pyridoxal-dependent ACC family enzyme